MSSSSERKLIPAQLGYLAIYNPSLGSTDETIENQIVYYTSQETQRLSKHRSRDKKEAQDAAHEQINLQLRQIGLAQGMVEFGKTFSDGKSVDAVETEKSRIILHELEAGWWLLASINFTILPSVAKGKLAENTVEYSAREVKPALLLLGDLLQAHSTFLLHHASSLSALFVRTKRTKFMSILGRYWDAYLSTWNVLMHGNPANNMYGGIKVAACGELGVGVGEEERGSGEREVLEGFVGRIEGLVDVVVSRFGEAPPGLTDEANGTKSSDRRQPVPSTPWLGTGNEPAAEDGAIFLGTGALSRKSIRDLSHWMNDLYRWGPYAYGVLDNPSSNRRIKKRRAARWDETVPKSSSEDRKSISPSTEIADEASQLTNSTESNRRKVSVSASSITGTIASSSPSRDQRASVDNTAPSQGSNTVEDIGKKFKQLMKLGYGTHWTLGNPTEEGERTKKIQEPSPMVPPPSLFPIPGTKPPSSVVTSEAPSYPENDSGGHYLIGLLGDIESPEENLTDENQGAAEADDEGSRVLLRTLTVELERLEDARLEADISIDLGSSDKRPASSQNTMSERTGVSGTSFESQDRNKTKKLQVVVYINRPFIFVLLFELRTPSLALTSLYRSLHLELGSLVKPLLISTSFRPSRPEVSPANRDAPPIHDLVWDPKLLTINSTIPNIPDPIAVQFKPPESFPWTRIEALNTHMQIVNTYMCIMIDRSQLERTCKTSRGWWVVWTRIPDPTPPVLNLTSGEVDVPPLKHEDNTSNSKTDEINTETNPSWRDDRNTSHATSTMQTSLRSGPAHPFLDAELRRTQEQQAPKDKEILLIRRASDWIGGRFSSGMGVTGGLMGEGGWGDGPARLVQGIGVDTKRYIEGLLNISR